MRNLDADQKPARFLSTSKFLQLGLLFCFMLCAANAAALHWQLNGVTFSDGGKAFGGFDFDATAGTYSNINITTTPGSVVAQGSYYSSAAPVVASTASSFNGVSTVPVFSGSTLTLALPFSTPLTGTGGTVSIGGTAAESTCANASCNSTTSLRTITAGIVSAIPASAPKRWYLNGVVLSDGAQVFGSFVYDSSSGAYSSISVTTTAGKAAPGAGYFVQTPSSGSPTSLSLVSASTIVPASTTTFSVTFISPLTNAGGTIGIAGVTEGTCTSANCSASNALRTASVAGSVSTTAETGYSGVLPQIADGGGFTTVFIITNPTGATITCRMTFWEDNGNSLPLSLNGAKTASSYVVVVPGHSTQFLSTPGAGASVTGWGLAENIAQLGVIAAFRLQVSNLPESEATVEAIPGTAGFAMAFDESPGFDTGFALANVSAFDTVIENLYFYDTTGALIYNDSTRTLGPHEHESFLFSSRYGAQLAGKRGTVRLYYGTQSTPAHGAVGLTGLGLRVNPGGTFTSLPTVSIEPTSSSE